MDALPFTLSHAQLVAAARSWVKRIYGCPVVISELVSAAMETPDVIGFSGHGRSILVECKASVADFRADRHKSFRRHAATGMGDFRFFMTAPGLLRGQMLPDGWGLLEVHAKRVEVVMRSHAVDCFCREAETQRHQGYCSPPFRRKAHYNEVTMLLSLIRRLAGPVGIRTEVDIAAYTKDEKGRLV